MLCSGTLVIYVWAIYFGYASFWRVLPLFSATNINFVCHGLAKRVDRLNCIQPSDKWVSSSLVIGIIVDLACEAC